ncbi:MAG: trehalose-phosphatase [Candidatus Paceibacterota bacterium]|jgi:trehalose 6-phosphate phosphatase
MKYIFSRLHEIEGVIKNYKNIALLLDFDGTISPIVKKPENAYITKETRSILKKINKVFPVVIITGRSFNVIIKKVGVNNFIYGASHGLEWNFDGKLKNKILPKLITDQLEQFHETLKKIKDTYPSLIIEEKKYSVTFHYHLMPVKDKKFFKKWLKKFLKNVRKRPVIKIFHDKETIDIVPSLNWTKGDIARLALKYLNKKNKIKFKPIYIGDSKTDEDAFYALSKGITIRVGKSNTSTAKWYMKNQNEVKLFLKWLLDLKL